MERLTHVLTLSVGNDACVPVRSCCDSVTLGLDYQ